jgi:hypothetical protein
MSTPIDQEPKRNETSLSPHPKWAPSRASGTENHALPSWESFPLQDRHLLIRLIVQTARRQVQEGRMQQGEEATR